MIKDNTFASKCIVVVVGLVCLLTAHTSLKYFLQWRHKQRNILSESNVVDEHLLKGYQ